MLQSYRFDASTPHPAIVLAGQNLTPGETTWTAEPHVGETAFSGPAVRWGTDYMHARYYKPIWGRFLSVDPKSRRAGLKDPQRWNRYAYAKSNPLAYVDPDGQDAIGVVFPEYRIQTPVGKVGGLGHAGVVTIDKSGGTRYYEYGRYDSEGRGLVRRVSVPNLKMGENGKPTAASLHNLMSALSTKAGHGGAVQGSYFTTDGAAAMNAYAEGRMAQNSDASRQSYSLFGNNCATFCQQTLNKGGADVGMSIVPSPNAFLGPLQGAADFTVSFNGNSNTTQVSCSGGPQDCPSGAPAQPAQK